MTRVAATQGGGRAAFTGRRRMSELTFIGLDVHARSVAAGVLEGSTGEVRSCTAPPRTADLVPWLREQGKSLSVAYEAGPTGFGLARACAAAGIPCLVAAPSRIARAPGERVKTDRRDALLAGAGDAHGDEFAEAQQ